MENNSFEYTYSAQRQQEVEAIRQKYLPKEEDKMEQLRRLHAVPMQKAQAAALAVGIIGALILGTGMIVDNAIIVVDNITARREKDKTRALVPCTVKAVREVFAPMLSSVLTTCSVFVPLIFLSGTTGALFYDHAVSVSVSLFASLLVAVVVVPKDIMMPDLN